MTCSENVNLRHGDPYGGSLALDQNFLWRPFASSPGYATPVERLWQIGASTWPGPGLGAGSGTLVALGCLSLRSRSASRRSRSVPSPKVRSLGPQRLTGFA